MQGLLTNLFVKHCPPSAETGFLLSAISYFSAYFNAFTIEASLFHDESRAQSILRGSPLFFSALQITGASGFPLTVSYRPRY
jgi:hypothetical protein